MKTNTVLNLWESCRIVIPSTYGLKNQNEAGSPATGLMLLSWLAYSSTLMMEATCFFIEPVDFQPTTRRYKPGDRIIHNHHSENLKFYTFKRMISACTL
jgi:hypothetical protein